MKYEITLKNIKHASFASQETHCFEASVYVNGKKEFKVSNDGHGGSNFYYEITGASSVKDVWERVREINTELKKELLPCSWDETQTIANDIDIVVGDLVNDWLENRDAKKHLRKICYIKNDGQQGFFTVNLKPTPENLDIVRAQKWWNKGYTFLNSMTFDQARPFMIEVS